MPLELRQQQSQLLTDCTHTELTSFATSSGEVGLRAQIKEKETNQSTKESAAARGKRAAHYTIRLHYLAAHRVSWRTHTHTKYCSMGLFCVCVCVCFFRPLKMNKAPTHRHTHKQSAHNEQRQRFACVRTVCHLYLERSIVLSLSLSTFTCRCVSCTWPSSHGEHAHVSCARHPLVSLPVKLELVARASQTLIGCQIVSVLAHSAHLAAAAH